MTRKDRLAYVTECCVSQIVDVESDALVLVMLPVLESVWGIPLRQVFNLIYEIKSLISVACRIFSCGI